MERLPDDHIVIVGHALGVAGEEQILSRAALRAGPYAWLWQSIADLLPRSDGRDAAQPLL